MTHSGGKPHNVGDQGQPYEVTYVDGDGNRKVFGWSGTSAGVARMMSSIDLHPVWNSPQWRDRRTGETGPAPSQPVSAVATDPIADHLSVVGDRYVTVGEIADEAIDRAKKPRTQAERKP